MRVRTDYGETVHISEGPHGDIRLWLTRDLPDMADERTDEVVLRPSQAERLAENLLAYANGGAP